MKDKILTILKLILLILFVGLVIYGQRIVGKEYLAMQLLGVAGIILLLWNYNKKIFN